MSAKQRTQYRTVDTSTLQGLKLAECLHRNGWTIARTGLFLIYFYKRPTIQGSPTSAD